MCPSCSSAPCHLHNETQPDGAAFIWEIASLVAEGKEMIDLLSFHLGMSHVVGQTSHMVTSEFNKAKM